MAVYSVTFGFFIVLFGLVLPAPPAHWPRVGCPLPLAWWLFLVIPPQPRCRGVRATLQPHAPRTISSGDFRRGRDGVDGSRHSDGTG